MIIFQNTPLAQQNYAQMRLNSQEVQANDLFVAVIGEAVDGRKFIADAILRGASAVLSETDKSNQHLTIEMQNDVPVLHYYQLKKDLSALAAQFYDNPTEKLQLVGVTGTNGKTTISQLFAQWAKLLGHQPAVMGTIGNGLLGSVKAAKNTTGSAVEIQAAMADFLAQGADFAAIEVSSHGLVQHRVDALDFNATIFTNLTRDHLDYHGTMANYANAKKRLFSEFNAPVKVINADDEIGAQWLGEMPNAIAVSCFAQKPAQAQYLHATNIEFTAQGATITIASSWGNGELHSPLIGAFNVSNLLLVMATMLALGFSFQGLIKTAAELKGVCGRMEVLHFAGKPTVIVDYAHTPDALEKALQAARIHCQGALWCVFGCGGDRDKGKRPLMAQIAEQFADKVIVTSDNPRSEDQAQIEQDIAQGFSKGNDLTISDRAQAIEFAIHNANANDLILIAGKGHENYQIIGAQTYHFSDQETAHQFLTK